VSGADGRLVRTTLASPGEYWKWIVLGYLAAAGVGAGFGALVRTSGSWETGSAWERRILEALHVELPPALDAAMLVLPWFGTNITLIPILILAAIWLDRARRRRDLAVHLLVVEFGSYTVNPLLKAVFSRARPDLWEKRGQFAWSSYPSGHAIASVAVLLAIAWALHRERGWRWPWVAAAALLAVSLYSRIYLGVHWLTDVLGGVLVGAVWLLATVVAYRAGGTKTG
jgi:membrane-associated phospholipid phosphatase